MERQPNPDDPAYRDQSTRRRLEEKKSKTPGEQLEEEGDYLDTGELDQEGKPLLSEKVGPDDIILEGLEEEKAKHGERDKAIQMFVRKGYKIENRKLPKPHNRDGHERVYRNEDGSIRKKIKIEECKVKGGALS